MSKMIELLDEELDQVTGAWGGFGNSSNIIVVSIVIVNNNNECGCF